jgi:hypothetical protein
LEHQSDKLWEI